MAARIALSRRTAANAFVALLVAALAGHVGYTYFGRNWREVLPGRVYRCAQMSPDTLHDTIANHGIKTVVNLRGCCQYADWYLNESRVTHNCDISQEDITLSAVRLPSPDEIRRLVEVIEHTDYPILIHCRQGIDRTGLVAALIVLLQTDATVAEAREQLGLRYGHVALGPTQHMRRFFDLYEEWLARTGQAHTRETARLWATEGYCPAQCRGRLDVLDAPAQVPLNEPFGLTVRATNTSDEPWEFQPGTYSGVCLKALMFDPDIKLLHIRHAGQFRATIPPGESVTLTLALGPLTRPGCHILSADMVAPRGWAFAQFGCEPLQLEIHAVESLPPQTGGTGGGE